MVIVLKLYIVDVKAHLGTAVLVCPKDSGVSGPGFGVSSRCWIPPAAGTYDDNTYKIPAPAEFRLLSAHNYHHNVEIIPKLYLKHVFAGSGDRFALSAPCYFHNIQLYGRLRRLCHGED